MSGATDIMKVINTAPVLVGCLPSKTSADLLSSVISPAPLGETKSASSQTGTVAVVSSAEGTGRSIRSGSEAIAYARETNDGNPPDKTGNDDDIDLRLSRFPLTDLGNAERFRERYKHKLIFCGPLKWLCWDGRRYTPQGAQELVQIAEAETVRAIQREAKAFKASGQDWLFDAKKGLMYSDHIASFGRKSEGINRLAALSTLGKAYLAVHIDQLDADPYKINFANGTLSINRNADEDPISFGPHDPTDLMTKISPVIYDPAAVCPLYDKFLANIQPHAPMRRFIHQWFGLSMTGDVSEQKFVFLYGKGRNGKSTLVDIVSYLAGDYGETIPIETFLDHGKSRSGGQATPDLALLPGVRLLRTSEPEKGAKLAESLIKLVTGGEPMQARDLNRSFFRFYPKFKLTMSGNYRPTISGSDEGIWRRMRLVPFAVQIAEEAKDAHLGVKLQGEASGILNRILDGVRDWCDHGLIEPEEVIQATATYRSDSDPLGRFLSLCVAAKPGGRVQSSVLHAVFAAWCTSNGDKEWSNRGFSMAMKERGYVSAQSNVVWWHDIELVKHVSDFVDANGKPRTMADENETTEPQEPAHVAF